MRDKPRWRWWLREVGGRFVFYGGILLAAWWWMLSTPGGSAAALPHAPTPEETALADALQRDVRTLTVEIGERNVPGHPAQLDAAAAFLETSLRAAGCDVQIQTYLPSGGPRVPQHRG
jgi:hypothetical protein